MLLRLSLLTISTDDDLVDLIEAWTDQILYLVAATIEVEFSFLSHGTNQVWHLVARRCLMFI